MKSQLSESAQKEVDEAIREYGARGLGYYYIKTVCKNCTVQGITLFKLGRESSLDNCFCVYCHSREIIKEKRINEINN